MILFITKEQRPTNDIFKQVVLCVYMFFSFTLFLFSISNKHQSNEKYKNYKHAKRA